jgi:hypothetical protein
MKTLKIFTYIYGFGIAGIVTCFGMSIYTAIQARAPKPVDPKHVIALPVLPSQ